VGEKKGAFPGGEEKRGAPGGEKPFFFVRNYLARGPPRGGENILKNQRGGGGGEKKKKEGSINLWRRARERGL